MLKSFLPLLLLAFLLPFASSSSSSPPDTVEQVDLSRYVGKWYEQASIPMVFAWFCKCSTAEYSAGEDGYVKVNNTCHRFGSFSSKLAKAWTVDSSHSKLKVQFFWPFSADYWIVDLDPNYQWSVVSNSKKSYLWILSREVRLEKSVYTEIVERLKGRGFPVEELNVSDQSCYGDNKY